MGNKQSEIEKREGRPIKQVLIEMYEKYGHEPRPQQAIATKLGVSQSTVSQWLRYERLVTKTVLVQRRDDGDE
jgi:DNA-binding MarR family transcriptional regulator